MNKLTQDALTEDEKDFSPIYHEIHKIRSHVLSNENLAKPVSWIEKSLTHYGNTNCLVIILPTGGCSWASSISGGCSFCGYVNDSYHQVPSDILSDFKKALLKHNLQEVQTIKIFNSGSYLDEKEIPLEIQLAILKEIAKIENIRELFLETRPEFVITNENNLKKYHDAIPGVKITFGIGLETSDDYIRKNFINKGFSFEMFKHSVTIVVKNSMFVKAYLIFKPPFLFESESIQDIVTSVQDLSKMEVSFISVNPITIHSKTLLDKLWRERKYRPPWLWSILQALQEIKKLDIKIPILCELVNPGKQRGPRNCGKCDKKVIAIIEDFSSKQILPNEEEIEELVTCDCKSLWKEIIDKEQFLGYPQGIEYRKPVLPRKNLGI